MSACAYWPRIRSYIKCLFTSGSKILTNHQVKNTCGRTALASTLKLQAWASQAGSHPNWSLKVALLWPPSCGRLQARINRGAVSGGAADEKTLAKLNIWINLLRWRLQGTAETICFSNPTRRTSADVSLINHEVPMALIVALIPIFFSFCCFFLINSVVWQFNQWSLTLTICFWWLHIHMSQLQFFCRLVQIFLLLNISPLQAPKNSEPYVRST